MKKGNLVAAAAFAAFAVYIIAEAARFPPGTAKVPGPAMFPTIIAVIILMASVFLFITSLRMRPAEDTSLDLGSRGARRVYISMAIMAAYVAIMPLVGFFTTSTVLLFALIQWFGKYRFLYSAVVAAVITGLVYGVFNYVLHVPFRFGVLL